ncbi:MAG: hypothetical protein JXN63_07590 [Candidatus Delongbacteria bacterium]|nr:hypothetical protein [Candidatus Delongbacteria bacterium]
MKRITHLIIAVIISAAFAEITFTQNETEYSLRLEKNDHYSVLSFRKSPEDSVYTYLKYSKSIKPESIALECKTIDSLWTLAEKQAAIGLASADIGYPLQYPDIMHNYIQAFLDSEEWMTHVSLKGKELNYELMHKVIYESEVFSSLTDLFNRYGYNTTGISTEKHGFVPKEDLVKYGFKGDEIIPMPFMLYWKLEKIKK